jgi:hypothetical protein
MTFRRALLSLPKIRELTPPPEEIVGATNSDMPGAVQSGARLGCGFVLLPVRCPGNAGYRSELASVSCLRCRKTLAIRQRESKTGPSP